MPRYWAPRVQQGEAKVGQWKATAISGNDLLSSCLYCSALVVKDAGWLAPICLLLVSGTLKLYQGVYWENGTALPFNGGVYTAAINSLNKPKACVLACCSLMSYIATCIVSSSSAVLYLMGLAGSGDHPLYMAATIAVMAAVGVLYAWGIQDSATVALWIFCAHSFMLVTLIFSSLIKVPRSGAESIFVIFACGCRWCSWTTRVVS